LGENRLGAHGAMYTYTSIMTEKYVHPSMHNDSASS